MLDLHIGAPKTGTNSVQRFMRAYQKPLRKHGVWYPDEGRSGHKHDELRTEIRATQGGGGRELAATCALCRAHPHDHVFVSEEALYRLPRRAIEQLHASLRDCGQVRILVWFRDYASHVVSIYSQAAKMGREVDSFDGFFEKYIASTSHAGTIRNWGEVFGWDQMVVRYYGKDTMVGGDTVSDCLALMGLDRAAIEQEGGAPRGMLKPNASPGWEALEIMRAVCLAMEAEADVADAKRLSTKLRAAVRHAAEAAAPAGSKVEYLSAAQRARCNEATLADIDFLNQRLRVPLPVPVFRDLPERAFMPSVAQVPAAMVTAAMASLALQLGQDLPDTKRDRKRERLERVVGPKSERKALRLERKRAEAAAAGSGPQPAA